MSTLNFTTSATTFSIIKNGQPLGTWGKEDSASAATQKGSIQSLEVADNRCTIILNNPSAKVVFSVIDTVQINGDALTGNLAANVASIEEEVLYFVSTGTGGTGVAKYWGQVATRSFLPVTIYANNNQFNSRSSHSMRDTVSALKIAIPNWRVSGTVSPYEIVTGGVATVKASIEYPAGVFTPLTFSGVASGTIASGSTILSDAATVAIPTGAKFWVRIFWTNAAGVLVRADEVIDTANGEGYEFANTGSLADKTTSGTISANGTLSFSPCAIIAETTKPSVLITGDSKTVGGAGTISELSGDVGNIAPSVGPWMGYINVGVGSEKIQNFIANGTRRIALAEYVSHVIIASGINDVGARTSAQVLADLVSAGALFPTNIKMVATIEPASVDGTTVNTTANTKVTEINNAIRGNLRGFSGFFDISDAVSTARNSGLWKSGYSTDWLHPNTLGYQQIKLSGVINPAMIFSIR